MRAKVEPTLDDGLFAYLNKQAILTEEGLERSVREAPSQSFWEQIEDTSEGYYRQTLIRAAKSRLTACDPVFFNELDVKFTALERAGGVTLSAGLRGALIGVIASGGEPPKATELVRAYERKADLANELADLLSSPLIALDLQHVHLIQDLRDLEADSRAALAQVHIPKGNTLRHAPTTILYGLTLVFRLAGGDFTVTKPYGKEYTGPFVDFLRSAWEVVPHRLRPASADEFARKGMKLLRKLNLPMQE